MVPILVTSARTGSTIILDIIYTLFKDKFNLKNNLGEFFNIYKSFKTEYKIIDGNICITGSIKTDTKWFTSHRLEQLKRLDMIKEDKNYLIKLFPNIELEVADFIKKNYFPIYLERKSKVKQFLSYQNLMDDNVAHYSINDTTTVESISINKLNLNSFIQHIHDYYKIKNQWPSLYSTIYYEDFIKASDKKLFLSTILNIDTDKDISIKTKPTPYIDDPEKIIDNPIMWEEMKVELLNMLKILKIESID